MKLALSDKRLVKMCRGNIVCPMELMKACELSELDTQKEKNFRAYCRLYINCPVINNGQCENVTEEDWNNFFQKEIKKALKINKNEKVEKNPLKAIDNFVKFS